MTSRHPAVSCACPKCQSERRTTPPPAAEEREALGATVSAFWDTKDTVESCINAVLSALAPYRAAEILAAEARGMGRARTVVQNTRDGMKFDPSATLEWRNAITGGFNAADLALRHELDAIERNERGAGK